MKIISKHKDYFDHMISVYGYDPTIVWDRRNQKPFNNIGSCKTDEGNRLFYICGEVIPVIKVRRKNTDIYECIFDSKDERIDNKDYRYDRIFLERYKNEKTNLNIKYRQPILMGYWEREDDYLSIPELKEYGFPSIIDPDTMYQKVYNFLSWLKDNPEPPNNQTDKDKIVAHGFDLKASFRPKRKKS